MCTKDEEDSIRKSMESIRSQTRDPDYVFICDASNDTTPDIIRDELEKSDIPFEVFRQEQYSGHGGARQELYERIQKVNPDIFCMLDAANAVNSDWINNIENFWEDNPKYDALTGPSCEQDVNRECTTPHDPLYYRHAAIALDVSLLDTIGGWDPGFDRGEDWDFALQMFRAGADVFTSSRWCSKYLNSEPSNIYRKRIAGNPTSVPYLYKYGTWYAKFHPVQIIKDIGSVFFYIITTILALVLAFAPQYTTSVVSIFTIYSVGFILGSVFYEDKYQLHNFKRALFLLLYTAPAAARSTKKVIQGKYQR